MRIFPLAIGRHDSAEVSVAAAQRARLALLGLIRGGAGSGGLRFDLRVSVQQRANPVGLIVAHVRDRRISALSRGVTLIESVRNSSADLPLSCSVSHAAPSSRSWSRRRRTI